MKTRRGLLWGIILMSWTFPGYTQTKADDSALLSCQITNTKVPQPTGALELNIIPQKEAEATMLLKQDFVNQSIILQSGISNLIIVQQSFTSGSLVLQQHGSSNHYRSTLAGENIELSLLQQGTFNVVDQNLLGGDQKFKIVQQGRNNDIQHQSERNSMPLTIIQTGSDMRLIIRSNN